MTAREKFTIGQRVQLSAKALDAGLGKRGALTGVVLAVSRGPVVRIRRDGTKTPQTWHQDYWTPVPAQEEAPS